ncbi:MAG: D-tyrosyl-tRNA(Tyr) deacylase [Planctomycetes bacterium]|nr:D-tyrosyl-tRNA(Tyr) deacylase [Planctomycetota bacterium]
MRAVVQRVRYGRVTVDGITVGTVGHGVVILLGVGTADDTRQADLLAAKCVKLRIFRDEDDKMNRSLLDSGGGALVVSQFTLYADTAKGNRPSFTAAAAPDRAAALYDRFCQALADHGVGVGRGVFGEHMEVELVNDGPVTICLDTDAWCGSN